MRHFLAWWSVIVLMLATLAGTFAFGALLLGYVARIAIDPAQPFGSLWHPVVAVPLGLFTTLGSAWLFFYGLSILGGVVRASAALGAQRAEPGRRVFNRDG